MMPTRKALLPLLVLIAVTASGLLTTFAQQSATPEDSIFLEAESFQVQDNGWRVLDNATMKGASGTAAFNGLGGRENSVATQQITIPASGTWRIWVRFMGRVPKPVAPFEVAIVTGKQTVAAHTFGTTVPPSKKKTFVWDSFDLDLKAGDYTLQLGKSKEGNPAGSQRIVDAFLLTRDFQEVPNHLSHGPQTWMKVTLGDGYEKPVFLHIFANRFSAPYYAHFLVSKDGVEKGARPHRQAALLSNGETTGWVNISEMIYQDRGAILTIDPLYGPRDNASRFKAVVEFAAKPSEAAVVKKLVVDYAPPYLHVVVPPDLTTQENIASLRSDLDLANAYGKIADHYAWPKIGRPPVKFPFLVRTSLNPNEDDLQVMARELKTLSNFGFNGINANGKDGSSLYQQFGFPRKYILNVNSWVFKGSYSVPDIEKMRANIADNYKSYTAAGVKPDEIVAMMIMDEPHREKAALLASDEASIVAFRSWIKSKDLTPADLLVKSWDEVKPVPETEREKFPALHYYSQQFRTITLGHFMALQKQLIHEQWKADFPVIANFSDGAVYFGNFYGQGLDYFTMLHETDQNAIWSECWANTSATYQDAVYNVELMRAAARKNGQFMGHLLIAYAGRQGYDIRLKVVSEAARGIKAFQSFHYGPVWATHEKKPWQANTQSWSDQSAAVREIGAVEDFLLPAQPQPAQVALLYSSAADAWTVQENLASGFDRMNTWLALTHAQIPVDVMGESDVADGLLAKYKAAFLSDPNLTRAAAVKLRDWVQTGGTLILAAGAGERDEFNRPLETLNGLLPYQRQPVQTLQAFHDPGRRLSNLTPQDTVSAGAAKIDVLSVKQTFSGVPQNGVTIEATFGDGSPAEIRSAVGKGFVVSRGYLPALDYMRKALVAKNDAATKNALTPKATAKKIIAEKDAPNEGIPDADDIEEIDSPAKSANPGEYPTEVRNAIIQPVRAAEVKTPIVCSVPLVDAVYMTSNKGIIIPLANYTLQPIKNMTLEIDVDRPVHEVESVYQGNLQFEKIDEKKIRVNLPLDCTDFITIH